MSLLQLLRQPADRNLLDVLTKLPQLGVGSRVTRKSWEPYGDSYWEVTAVKPRKPDGKHGKVSSGSGRCGHYGCGNKAAYCSSSVLSCLAHAACCMG